MCVVPKYVVPACVVPECVVPTFLQRLLSVLLSYQETDRV